MGVSKMNKQSYAIREINELYEFVGRDIWTGRPPIEDAYNALRLPQRELSLEDVQAMKDTIVSILKKLGVKTKYVPIIDDPAKIRHFFRVEGGKPYIEFNDLEGLGHEVVHYLQWLTLGGTQKAYELMKAKGNSEIIPALIEAKAKVTNIYILRNYGSYATSWVPDLPLEECVNASLEEVWMEYYRFLRSLRTFIK